jgi:CBS domain-containing protein
MASTTLLDPPGSTKHGSVALLLTPKAQVIWVESQQTVEQALERLQRCGYTAIPILDQNGGYVGTLSEGDVLRHLLRVGENWRRATRYVSVATLERRSENRPVHIDAPIDVLIVRTIDQNFVPVIDDRGVFIGIVPRKSVIEHCARSAGLLESAPKQSLCAGGSSHEPSSSTR